MPVIVIDPVPVCDLGLLEQPATVTKTNIAATIPKRRRRRCVIGIMNNIEIPRTRKTTCLTDVDGGLLAAGGGATNDTVAVTLATAVGLIIPEVTVTLVGIIVQDVTFGVFPVQVKFTAPVKPCDPVTVTGTEPASVWRRPPWEPDGDAIPLAEEQTAALRDWVTAGGQYVGIDAGGGVLGSRDYLGLVDAFLEPDPEFTPPA